MLRHTVNYVSPCSSLNWVLKMALLVIKDASPKRRRPSFETMKESAPDKFRPPLDYRGVRGGNSILDLGNEI